MFSRPRYLVAGLMLLMVFLVACGDGNSPAADGTSSLHRDNSTAPADSPQVDGKPTCTSGKAVVGPGSGAIRFSVQCWAPPRGATVGFTLARYSLEPKQSRPGFRRLPRRPAVTGPGAKKPNGRCDRRGSVLDCQARARGQITIAGEIEVNPATRCSMGISITVAEPSKCTGHVCPADLVTRELAKGVPRGC